MEYVRANTEEAAEWISRFPEGDLRTQANNILISQWSREAPAKAADWINKLTDEPTRQKAIETFVGQVAHEEPSAAFTWAGALKEESIRNAHLESSAAAWIRLDPVKAAIAIKDSGLPAEVIERLLKSNP
jgi:hypothetical protein